MNFKIYHLQRISITEILLEYEKELPVKTSG